MLAASSALRPTRVLVPTLFTVTKILKSSSFGFTKEICSLASSTSFTSSSIICNRFLSSHNAGFSSYLNPTQLPTHLQQQRQQSSLLSSVGHSMNFRAVNQLFRSLSTQPHAHSNRALWIKAVESLYKIRPWQRKEALEMGRNDVITSLQAAVQHVQSWFGNKQASTPLEFAFLASNSDGNNSPSSNSSPNSPSESKGDSPSSSSSSSSSPNTSTKNSSPPNNASASSKESSSSSTSSSSSSSSTSSKKNTTSSSGGSTGPKNPTPNFESLNPAHIFMFMGGALLYLLYLESQTDEGEEVSFQEFKSRYLATGLVESIVVVNKTFARVILKQTGNDSNGRSRVHFNIGSVDSFEKNIAQAQLDAGLDHAHFIPIRYVSETKFVADLIGNHWPTFLFLGAMWYFFTKGIAGASKGLGGGMGGRNPFQFGKANPTVITKQTNIKTTFKDVAGLDEAKIEVMEFVEFLKNPQKFTQLGAKLPKGALLVGPPGTGKTLLARATAGEAGVPFFSMAGSDFLEMFVGVGPSRVRDLFKQARESAPCIVFIDEIDAVGRSRSKNTFGGGHDERENTLNQMLVEMDGFNTQTGVVVLAGTNRPDILDSALLRPGRFDRQITIGKPDIKGRADIFKVHLKGLKLADELEQVAQRLAALTPGFSGADIANLCNEAALIAARNNKTTIELVDFESATDRVIGGLEKKNKIMSKKERTRIAFHESGHAVAGWFLEHADPLLKVTIVARGQALGFAQYLPQELHLYSQNQITDRMCMALAGRAAEQVFFGDISTGAIDDLKKVTAMAYSIVSRFGMNNKIGHVSFDQQGDKESFQKPYSEKTAQIIDEEVKILVKEAYEKTVALVTEKKLLVEKLANKLLEVETVNHDIIVQLLGDRPFSTHAYDEYVKNIAKPIINNNNAGNVAENSNNNNNNNNNNKNDDAPLDTGDQEPKPVPV